MYFFTVTHMAQKARDPMVYDKENSCSPPTPSPQSLTPQLQKHLVFLIYTSTDIISI